MQHAAHSLPLFWPNPRAPWRGIRWPRERPDRSFRRNGMIFRAFFAPWIGQAVCGSVGSIQVRSKEDVMGYERNTGRPDSYYRDRDRREAEQRYRGRDEYRDRDYGGPPRDYRYEDRGFFDRAGDEVRSWFGDDEAERRRRWDERVQQREYERQYGRGGGRFAGREYGGGYDPALYGGVGTPGFGATYGEGRGAGATSTWGLGAGQSHDDWGRDPNYRVWRDRHVSELDRDYDEYRRENQSRFENDFGSWRTTRQGQRDALRQVREHQEVVGSDGQHVGTVDHIRGDRILLTKDDKDASGHHHSIPCSWITKVGDKVEISRTASQAQSVWKDEEDQQGPRNLNRAFSGTY